MLTPEKLVQSTKPLYYLSTDRELLFMTRKRPCLISKPIQEWRRYERAMFNELYYVYRPPHFIVLPDYNQIIGQISAGKRQIDVAVIALENKTRPFISVESKYYARKINIKDVEAFIGMQQDIGSRYAIMVAPRGFTPMAHQRIRGTNIELLTMPITEAERLNWREVVRKEFRLDETFHPVMGDAIHRFNTTNDYEGVASVMEGLPFDEWEILFSIYQKVDDQKCKNTLEYLSISHYDPDWIFNTVRLLDEFGWLTQDFVNDLIIAKQVDNDLWEYLKDMSYFDET